MPELGKRAHSFCLLIFSTAVKVQHACFDSFKLCTYYDCGYVDNVLLQMTMMLRSASLLC